MIWIRKFVFTLTFVIIRPIIVIIVVGRRRRRRRRRRRHHHHHHHHHHVRLFQVVKRNHTYSN